MSLNRNLAILILCSFEFISSRLLSATLISSCERAPIYNKLLFHLMSVLSYHFLNEITFLSFTFSLSDLTFLHFLGFLSKFK
jgi:hypothetical protein